MAKPPRMGRERRECPSIQKAMIENLSLEKRILVHSNDAIRIRIGGMSKSINSKDKLIKDTLLYSDIYLLLDNLIEIPKTIAINEDTIAAIPDK